VQGEIEQDKKIKIKRARRDRARQKKLCENIKIKPLLIYVTCTQKPNYIYAT
jgi:hypothetical protein